VKDSGDDGKKLKEQLDEMKVKHETLTRCQSHQHFTRAFCADIFAPKNYKAKHNHRKAA